MPKHHNTPSQTNLFLIVITILLLIVCLAFVISDEIIETQHLARLGENLSAVENNVSILGSMLDQHATEMSDALSSSDSSSLVPDTATEQ